MPESRRAGGGKEEATSAYPKSNGSENCKKVIFENKRVKENLLQRVKIYWTAWERHEDGVCFTPKLFRESIQTNVCLKKSFADSRRKAEGSTKDKYCCNQNAERLARRREDHSHEGADQLANLKPPGPATPHISLS